MKKKLEVKKPKQKPLSKENSLCGMPFDEIMKRGIRVNSPRKAK